jgi:hypothetical protein
VSREGDDARDEGIDRVMTGEALFSDRVISCIRHLSPGECVIGEDIKILYLSLGFPRPHHHNCWGGIIRRCRTLGLLEPTGMLRHTALRPSHSRASVEYRRV